ncbi:transcriptional regulator Kaiso [Sardina pilchardus]|uniref:transcriptional regulator Kaiso n=1 Tax=Sardina pilchardus TaxID=27697 RepID=UPI002E14F3DD
MSSLKLISATDTQFPASVLKSINEQRNNGLFCDVTIIVQDRKFKAHKIMLSASSTYFRQLFSVAGQVIELNFIKGEIFEEILNYIYTSKISRVRSDKLEDLISAGQILGVKFIANLGVPLAQVKGLPGLSKDGEGSGSSSEKNESGPQSMPIITESFSLSAEEFNMSKEADADNDDVLFVSKSEPSKAGSNRKSSEIIDVDAEEGLSKQGGNEPSKEVNRDASKEVERKEKNPMTGKADGGKESHQNSPVPSQRDAVSLSGPMMSPDSMTSVPSSPAGSSTHSQPTTPVRTNSLVSELHSPPLPIDNNEVLGVQKKKVTTILEQSPDRQGKIKLSDVRGPAGGKNGPGGTVVTAKKTITLDKASEIDSLSTGCKVYANIGENTYDIVPVKEDPGEGDSRTGVGKKSAHGTGDASSLSPRGPSKKKAKMEPEDHYELIMDGKTFYVCVVCKRPYVCLTSLRRHFNTHSWEKKYPCHYCDKVFALAEYRTKHEISHTGERRYQCLMCNETFMNYQLLSSHCKQVHNQDPSGRKEKDDNENNLYRLLPCKTLQFKPYSYVSENAGGIPVINEEGIVQHINPGRAHFTNQALQPSGQSKILSWDDIFVEPDAHTRPGAHARPLVHPRPGASVNAEGSEFEFVIPETY